MRKQPKDPRSTGRKRGRMTLIKIKRPYVCQSETCGHGPDKLPDTIPKDLQKGIELAPPDKQVEGLKLECNHENKNILDNDPANLRWLCRYCPACSTTCHANEDNKTSKGVSKIDDEFGYGKRPW